MALKLPQLIETRVVAVGDHAAVDHPRGGLGMDRLLEKLERGGGCRQLCNELFKERCRVRQGPPQLGQQLDAVAQPGELARAHAFQREPRRNAFDVGESPKNLCTCGSVLTASCRAASAVRSRSG